MECKYVDHMGSDLSVVNAARVSFAKEHKTFDDDKDPRLIRYLAKHNHWTPFGHTAVTVHVKAPLFVARQLGKHQVGLVWNEVSRRYVDDPPEFYMPETWRGRASDKKQGSDEETSVDSLRIEGDPTTTYQTSDLVQESNQNALALYEWMVEGGVCPEQARMVLPQSMYTEWYWTGSIAAFARVCKLRLDPHTQKETREVAQQISGIIRPLFPSSWSALMD